MTATNMDQPIHTCKYPVITKAMMREIDDTWAESSHKIGLKYFRKMFNRTPIHSDAWAVYYSLQVYYFEFDRWADGKVTYNAMSKKNAPKHRLWVEKQLIKHKS